MEVASYTFRVITTPWGKLASRVCSIEVITVPRVVPAIERDAIDRPFLKHIPSDTLVGVGLGSGFTAWVCECSGLRTEVPFW